MKYQSFIMRVLCLLLIVGVVLGYNSMQKKDSDTEKDQQIASLTTRVEALEKQQDEILSALEEAAKAQEGAKALFGAGGNTTNMPTTALSAEDFADGKISILDLLVKTGLAASKGEARRLVQQGGVSAAEEKVTDIGKTFSETDFSEGQLILKKGKKVFHKVTL